MFLSHITLKLILISAGSNLSTPILYFFFSIKWLFHTDFGFYMFFFRDLLIVLIFVQWAIVSFEYNSLIFVAVVQHLIVFE